MNCSEILKMENHILLVEDNEDDEKLTLRAFQKHNFINKIEVVRDGEEALDYLFARNAYSNRSTEDAPKLILLDLKLPKVDGIEVLRQIKTDERTKKIPTVVLTSSSEEIDLLHSYQSGANSYIVKPVDFESFLKAVLEIGFYWLMFNETPQNSL